MKRPPRSPLPSCLWALLLLAGAMWAISPLALRTLIQGKPGTPRPGSSFLEPEGMLTVQAVELVRPAGWKPCTLKANLTEPLHQMYFPKLYAPLLLRNLPCVGIRDRPVLSPKPMPKEPRFVLLVDSWERQQTGTKTVENAATIVERFGLVFVMPHVRMSNIQGIPGWTQWKSTHALDGFTAAKYLMTMGEYYDLDFTRGYLPLVSFDEFMELSNYTITTALMLDWEKNNCSGNRPEWYPAYGARIQATQLYCMPGNFPSANLSEQVIRPWFTYGAGQPIPEAQGRPPPKLPSVAFLNWRKNSFGSHVWDESLWGGKCRFRWAPKWNQVALDWAREVLPDKYVGIKIRSGDWLRWFWIPKKLEDVKVCFDHIAAAAKYYLRKMGLPEDAPVYLSTEWPNPPESRWHFGGVSIITASFNSLFKELNLVTYKNRAYDIGITTIISFNILLNAAVVVGFEDTMMAFVRQYNPAVPIVAVGGQSERKCNNWNPPADGTGHRFLYLVQGKEFLEKARYSDDSDTLCLTFGKKVEFCEYLPSSTWTEGRNHLWKTAVRLKHKYEYYIFMDHDITLSSNAVFESLLLRWRPAIGVPAGAMQLPNNFPQRTRGALRITAFHASLNAFHRDVFFHSVLLPYYDGMDSFSWWTSQLYLTYLSRIFYSNEVYGFPNVNANNWQRGQYPDRWDLSRMNAPFFRECITDPSIQRNFSQRVAPHAEPVAEPLPEGRSHAMPETLLVEHLSRNTVYWKRVRQMRQEALP
eukprot:GGOE01042537.1.p1 GENE.GGOE01042537.1~~GGOE01042537.1.p1  ORF type:complete len:754 (+),score=168.46 GGOE01042537.1:56-2317(+)